MPRTGRPPKPLSRVEREWIERNLGRLSVREMAERLDIPKSTVQRRVSEIRSDMGLPMPPDPRWPDRDEPDPPDGEQARLQELAMTLRAALLSADEKNVAAIAREYRETVRRMQAIEERDAQPAADARGGGKTPPTDPVLERVRANRRGHARDAGGGRRQGA